MTIPVIEDGVLVFTPTTVRDAFLWAKLARQAQEAGYDIVADEGEGDTPPTVRVQLRMRPGPRSGSKRERSAEPKEKEEATDAEDAKTPSVPGMIPGLESV